jgi:CheY-like chemotaxis protein
MATGNGTLLGGRILLVRGDPTSRDVSTAALQTVGGATVTAVASAHEALAVIDDLPPHVLVTDLSLPDGDGRVLLDRVRALPRGRGGAMPVVALAPSARGGEATIAEGASLEGFQARLTTPVEAARLCATIAGVLQGRQPSASV